MRVIATVAAGRLTGVYRFVDQSVQVDRASCAQPLRAVTGLLITLSSWACIGTVKGQERRTSGRRPRLTGACGEPGGLIGGSP
jgi:hypothetical protein